MENNSFNGNRMFESNNSETNNKQLIVAIKYQRYEHLDILLPCLSKIIYFHLRGSHL